MSWVTRVTDIGACAVARGCPLHTLSLHGLKSVGEPSMSALVEHCAATLVALDVRGCVRIEGRTPEALVRVLPRLTTFVIHMT